jgi:hypothetical protein
MNEAKWLGLTSYAACMDKWRSENMIVTVKSHINRPF